MSTSLLERPVRAQPDASLVRRPAAGAILDNAWNAPLATKLHWILRMGVAAEFIGHGLAGLYRSPAWIPYFTLFGFSKQFAHDHLFYVTGTVDITLALLVLFRPMRAVLLHMAFWGMFTAWLRPVVGESWFELVERGANYGMPLAFLMLSGLPGRSWRSWFEQVRPREVLFEDLALQLAWVMRVSIFLLLVGHGGLGIFADKKEWYDFFGWFGISHATVSANHLMQWVGLFEVALGVAVLVKPLRGLLLFVLVYKVGTELLRPLVGQPNFQFIERAGDYVLPIALLWVLNGLRNKTPAPVAAAPLDSVALAARPAPREYPRASPAAAVHANGNGNGTSPKPHAAPASPDPDVLAAAAALTARLAARRADHR